MNQTSTKQRKAAGRKPKTPKVHAPVQMTRYSDETLEEFKGLIQNKIIETQKEIQLAQNKLEDLSNIESSDKMDEVASAGDTEVAKNHLANKLKYLHNLNNAMHRITNKIYGICAESGRLIPIARLRANLIATKTIEAKLAEQDAQRYRSR